MAIKTEQWRMIPGYDDMYMASNLGNIKSLRFGKEKILKTREKNNGYLIVNVCHNKKPFTKTVHRLVASAFYGELQNGMTVNHKDFNKVNNCIENLEVIPLRDNISHSFIHKRRNEDYKKGSKNGRSKLTESDIERIRSLEDTGVKIAEMYNVSTTVVYSILKRKSWKHV